jgi:hypothetical protein
MSEEKILGKYNTQEDFIAGHIELQKAFDGKSNFEKKYNETLVAPESYQAEGELNAMPDDFIQSQAAKAKSLNLNQTQFEKFATANFSAIDNTPKPEVTEELKSYVKDLGLTENIINNMNQEDVEKLEAKRQTSLNTNIGVTSSSSGSPRTQEDIAEAYREFMAFSHSSPSPAKEAAFNKWKALLRN